MEFWMSGEIQNDVYNEYRSVRKSLEHQINRCIGNKEYGIGLKEWAYLAIIRKEDSKDYDEVAEYSKKKKEAEFRLKIDHNSFLYGEHEDRVRLISDSILRSLEMMPNIGVVDVDLIELKKDISNCLLELNRK
jgi:hypothetical protein